MTAEFSQSAADVEALSRQVHEVEAHSAGLAKALLTSRQTSLYILLGALLFVIVVAGSFIKLGKDVISEKNRELMVQLAQQRLIEHSDDYMREAKLLVNATSPKLSAAFAERAKQDMPLYVKAVDTQRGPMFANIEKRLGDMLTARQQIVVASKKQMLIEAFPSIEDPKQQDAMVANLGVAVDKVIKKHYLDRLHEELLALAKNLDEFPAAEVSSGKNSEKQLEDDLMANLMELVSLRLTQPAPVIEMN